MFQNSADGQTRADKFITDIFENRKVYYMLHPEGGAFICTSNEFSIGEEPAPVIPVWSTRYLPYAKKYGEGLVIEEISVDEFINQMLPAMIRDNIPIGINWDKSGCGVEMQPAGLYDMINGVRLD